GYVGAETYVGRHGMSLRLDGLEPGFNGHARARDIVVHGAGYVSRAHIEQHGRLGRSWGCPAVRPAVSGAVIQELAGGGLLLAWAPDAAWQEGSALLACGRSARPSAGGRMLRSSD
ncbi:MAG: murein L,D-transpeptidase catalytic domain family protein, partial [Myxococcota bacterium]|nr:murein L,D-transpeptidase catalytic domain family protein [Myxococcota bacterium]